MKLFDRANNDALEEDKKFFESIIVCLYALYA